MINFNAADLNKEILNLIYNYNGERPDDSIVIGPISMTYDCDGDSQSFQGILLNEGLCQALKALGYEIKIYQDLNKKYCLKDKNDKKVKLTGTYFELPYRNHMGELEFICFIDFTMGEICEQ